MKFYSKAFTLLTKNFVLAVPMFAALFLPALILSFVAAGSANALMNWVMANAGNLSTAMDNPAEIMAIATQVIMVAVGGVIWVSLISMILSFLAQPITYGMINSATTGEKVGFESIVPALGKNIVPFILFVLLSIVFWLVFSIAAGIVMFILSFLFTLIKLPVLVILVALAVCAFGIIIAIKLSFWFIIMVNEGASVIDALKKSIEMTKGVSLSIFGIQLLNALIFTVISAILGLILGWIPLVGAAVSSAVSTVSAIVIIIFLFYTYLNKAGKLSEEA